MVIATPICAKDAEERNSIAIASSNGRMNRLRIRDHLLLRILRRLRERAFPVGGVHEQRIFNEKFTKGRSEMLSIS
jgi:hypothetical protein